MAFVAAPDLQVGTVVGETPGAGIVAALVTGGATTVVLGYTDGTATAFVPHALAVGGGLAVGGALAVTGAATVTGTLSSGALSATAITTGAIAAASLTASGAVVIGSDPFGGAKLRVGGDIRANGELLSVGSSADVRQMDGSIWTRIFSRASQLAGFLEAYDAGAGAGAVLYVQASGGPLVIGADTGGAEKVRLTGSLRLSGAIVQGGAAAGAVVVSGQATGDDYPRASLAHTGLDLGPGVAAADTRVRRRAGGAGVELAPSVFVGGGTNGTSASVRPAAASVPVADSGGVAVLFAQAGFAGQVIVSDGTGTAVYLVAVAAGTSTLIAADPAGRFTATPTANRVSVNVQSGNVVVTNNTAVPVTVNHLSLSAT